MATPEEDRLRRLLELLGEPAPMSTGPESDLLFAGPPPVTPTPTPAPKPPVAGDNVRRFQEFGLKVPSAGPTTPAPVDNTSKFQEFGLKVPSATPSIPRPAVVPPAAPTTSFIPSKELIKEQEKVVQEASVGPFGEVDVAAEESALKATEDILTTDYTPGGTPQEYYFDLAPYVPRTPYEEALGTLTPRQLTEFGRATAADIEAAGGSVFSALRPQVVAPKFAEQQAQFQFTIDETIKNIKSLPELSPEQRQVQATALKEFWKEQPEVVSKIDQILSGTIEAGDLDSIVSEIETAAKELAPEKSWFLTEDAGGRLVESTPLWLLRLLNAPVAAVAGGLEGTITSLANAATSEEFDPTQVAGDIINSMTRYVREGRSFTDVASQTFGYLGRVADEQLFGSREAFEAEEIAAGLGGVAGFAADILTGPTDIAALAGRAAGGVGAAAAKAATAAAKVLPEAVKAPITGIAKQVVDKAAGVSTTPVAALVKAAGGDIVKLDDIKVISPTRVAPGTVAEVAELGEDTLSQVVSKQKQVLIPTDPLQPRPLLDFVADPASDAGRAAAPVVKASGVLDNIPTELLQKESAALGKPAYEGLDEVGKFEVAASVIRKALSSQPAIQAQQLEKLVEQNITQNILREINSSSYRQTAKIASTLTRIIPGRFVAADAVQPILEAATETVQKLWRQVQKDGSPTSNFEFIGEGEYRLRNKTFKPGDVIDATRFKNVMEDEIASVMEANKVAYIPATRLEKVISDISSAVQQREPAVGRLAKTKRAARSLVSEINITPLRQLFIPKEIQPAMLGVVANAAARVAGFGKPVGPLADFVSSVTNGWGSIFDSFKKEAAAAKNFDGRTLRPEEVYARVIFQDPGRYFDEYLKMLYGATDDFAEVYKGLSSSIGMKGDKRSLVKVLEELANVHLADANALFVKNYSDGNFNEAFDALRKVHFYLADRPLGTMISSANPSITDKIALMNARISPNDIMQASSITWARIKQADILKNRIEEFAAKNPEAFALPSDTWFEDIFKDYTRKIQNIADDVDATASAKADLKIADMQGLEQTYNLTPRDMAKFRDRYKEVYKDAITGSSELLTALGSFPNIIKALVKSEVEYSTAARLAEQLGTPAPKRPAGFYAILDRFPKRFIVPKGMTGKPPREIKRLMSEKAQQLQASQKNLQERITAGRQSITSRRNALETEYYGGKRYLDANRVVTPQNRAEIKRVEGIVSNFPEELRKLKVEEARIKKLQTELEKVQSEQGTLVVSKLPWADYLRDNETAIIKGINQKVDDVKLQEIRDNFPLYQEVLSTNDTLDDYIQVLEPYIQDGLNRAFIDSPVLKSPQDLNNISAFVRGSLLKSPQDLNNISAFVRGSLLKAAPFENTTSIVDILNRIVDLEKTGMAKRLVEASDVRSLSSTLQDIILPVNRTTVPAEELIKLDQALNMSFEELQKLPVPVRQQAVSGFNQVLDAFDRANNFAKTGVLSGFFAPNLGYMMDNLLTLPLITLTTLGEKAAIKGTITSLAGLPGLAIKNFSTNGSKVFNGLLGAKAVPRETVLQLGGKAYSVGELVDAIVDNSVLATRMGSEISSRLVDDLIAYSGRTADSSVASAWKNLFERELGGVGKRGNFLSKASEAVDKYWRTNVFVNALEAGSDINEAAKLARESLFDYGSLTKFEREKITKAIWFYTFWSRNLITVFNTLLSNPDRLAKLYRIQKATRPDQPSYEAEYTQSRLFKVLSEKDGTKTALVGPSIPGIDGLDELLSYGGAFANLVAAASSFDLNQIKPELDKVLRTGMAIPLTKLSLGLRTILSYMYGEAVQDDGTVRPLSNYLDPKFTWWLQQNPAIWNAFTSIVPVEIEQSIKPGPTYYGLQYKVKDGQEGWWYLFQQALVWAAINRNMRDYAEVLDPFIGRGGLPTDVGAFQTESSSGLEWFGRASGAVSPVSTMTEEERQLRIIRDQTRRMKAIRGE